MSRIRSKGAAASRRSRRAEQQPVAAAFVGTEKVVSNPIFCCEDEPGELRCAYGDGTVRALVHVPGDGKPLPLPPPPSRAHRAGQGRDGTHVPAWRVGPTIVVSLHGRMLRRMAPQYEDPFVAAYVACTETEGGGVGGEDDGAQAKEPKQQRRQHPKKKTWNVRGCGMWNGWAAGAKYAGALSCRHGGAVTVLQGDAAAPATAPPPESPARPRLNLSRPPARFRALERSRAQS